MAVVLVTGASSGIGLATVRAFAEQGDRAYGSVRDDAGAAAVRAAGAEPVRFDVRDDGAIREAVAGIGAVDILVNNAGIGVLAPIETTTDEQWRDLVDVNLLGVVRVTRAVLPAMRARGSGVIVNVTSMNGRVPAPYGGAYSATTFAVAGLSEVLLHEVEPFGVRVAVVEPGQYDTPMFAKLEAGVARSADPSSPYADAMARALGASVPDEGGAADPAEAAAVIVEVATGARPGFRHVAGVDAEALLAARQRATDDEWVDIVRAYLRDGASPL